MDLNKLLLEYRQLTLELINSVNDIDKIKDLSEKRQTIIENINSSSFEKGEFKEIAENLNLLELENNLVNKMKSEKVNTKRALENLRKLKKARSIYNKEDGRPAFFNMISY